MVTELINYILIVELSLFTIYLVNMFFEIFLPQKSDKRKKILLWLLFGIIVCMQEYYKNINFNLLSNFFIIYIVYKVYDATLKKVVYLFFLYCGLSFAIELFTVGIVSIFINDFYGPFYLSSIISKIGILIGFRFLKCFFGNKVVGSHQYEAIYLGVLILSAITMYLINPSDASNEGTSQNAVISSAFVIIVNLVFFWLNDLLVKENIVRNQNLIYKQRLDSVRRQIDEREESFIKFRKEKHDMKNHLIFILELVNENNYNKVVKYINDLLKMNEINGELKEKTNNIVIDALLSHEMGLSKKNDIEFRINKLLIPNKLEINDADLCVILGNIFDNAMEAAAKVKNKENRYIDISLTYSKSILSINVKNTFNGDIRLSRGGEILTTKEDQENHGIGMKSIEMVTSKYDGQVKYEIDNNEFSTMVMLYL